MDTEHPTPKTPLTSGVFFTALVLWALSGCASTPEQHPANGADKESPYAILLEQQVGLYRSESLAPLIHEIAARLLADSSGNTVAFRVHLIDQHDANAFSAPDGTVYLTRGILALTNSEDDLAAILGHEFAHLRLRHHERQSRTAVIPGLIALPSRAIARLVHRDLGDLISRVSIAGYSRAHEYEADQEGIRLAAQAGYRPEAMADMLRHIQEVARIIEGLEIPSSGFADIHPSTPDRIERIYTQALNIEPAPLHPVTPSRRAYLAKLDGLILGQNPAKGLFRGNCFSHLRYEYTLTFPTHWNPFNAPSVVGAFSTDHEAAFLLGLAGYGTDSEAYAARTRREFQHEYGIAPVRDEWVDLHGTEGRLLVYRERSEDTVTSIFFLWIEHYGRILQLLGVAPEKYRKDLEKTAFSFRALARDELQSISVHRIRLAQALANESLPAFCTRTENALSPEATAVLNGLFPDITLRGGEWLKIVRVEPYLTNTLLPISD